MIRLKFLFSLMILHIFYFQGISQEETKDLDPVTVISSIQLLSASRTGRNIIVVKGEQLNKLPIHSIDELLRYLPGLEVQARGPAGTQSDLIIRGGTFQQVLVMLDGVRINDPTTGHFNSYIPIAPEEIERIEILKGASSALYGSEAVGGVIQIITKTFTAGKNIKQHSLNAQLTTGNYNFLHTNAGGFYNNGKTSVGGGILTNNSKGQPLRGSEGYFRLLTASVSANHYINDNFRIGIRSAYDDRSFSAQNFYTTFASDTATEHVRSTWSQSYLSYQKGRNKFNVEGGFKTSDDKFFFNPKSTPNFNKSNLLQAVARNEYKLNTEFIIITGIQFIRRSIKSNDRGNHDENLVGSFVTMNYTGKKGFSISPAIRVDHHQLRTTEIVPQVNLSYRLEQIQLRGSAGKTIRDADFTERYNNYNKSLVTSGRLGNPDLHAEYSFSYEAGADLFLKNLKIGYSYFQRNHTDLIDYVTTAYAEIPRKDNLLASGNYALAKNIAKVRIKGVETDIQYSKTWSAKKNIFGSLGFVWLDSKNSETTPALYISSYAKFLSNFSIHYTFSHFGIGINGLYKQRDQLISGAIQAKTSKDYIVINTKSQFRLLQDKLSLIIQVDNIFDVNYSDLLGAQMPGRWFKLGVGFTF